MVSETCIFLLTSTFNCVDNHKGFSRTTIDCVKFSEIQKNAIIYQFRQTINWPMSDLASKSTPF